MMLFEFYTKQWILYGWAEPIEAQIYTIYTKQKQWHDFNTYARNGLHVFF